ncbi:hypothetical protein IKG10_01850 [Candidatus Saccharibacteria bacterium]|nr:hypothetical protein [Candidatus Saccharibacteria bacterium]
MSVKNSINSINIATNLALYIFAPLISLTILSGIILNSSTVSADDSTVDQVTINVPVSCSMTGTGMNSHTAEITNGTYTADIGTTTLKAYCNDSNGFSIYTIGYTNDTYGTTTLIGQSTSNTIVTGTATSAGNPDTSNWAMKLATVSSPTPTYPIALDNGYGSYSIVPSTYTKVAHRDSGTDIGTNAEGSTLTTTYAAYISRTQPADTYEGKVKYTLVHPEDNTPKDSPMECSGGYICYSPNANDTLGTMGNQSASDGNSIDLLASNFSRTGYGFAGWSDAFDYTTNQNAHFYGPQETITVPTGTTTNGLSLYAVWIKSQGSLQDSTKVAQLCGTGAGSLTTAPTDGTANLASVSALTDSRDNNTYAIAKLADGKCWMIENLRLESTNSDNSTGALAQGYGTSSTYGNFSGLADAESANFSNSTTANSLYYSGTQSGTASINIGTSNYPGYRMPRYNNLNTPANASNRPQNPTSNTFTNNNTTVGMYSYGNYYTWHAAIADLTYNGTNNSSVTNPHSARLVGTYQKEVINPMKPIMISGH